MHVQEFVFFYPGILWSDGAAMSPRVSVHACKLSGAHVNAKYLKSDLNCVYLGTTAPALKRKFCPKDKAAFFTNLKRFVHQLGMFLIVEEVYGPLQSVGFVMQGVL